MTRITLRGPGRAGPGRAGQVVDPAKMDKREIQMALDSPAPFDSAAQLKFRSVLARMLEIVRRRANFPPPLRGASARDTRRGAHRVV